MAEKKPIRVDLSQELAEDLEHIKEFLGLKNDSEAIRFCIREVHRAIKEERLKIIKPPE